MLLMKTQKILKVMISCPRDVSEEAETVDNTLAELNRSIGDLLDVRFEVFRWERDSTPGLAQHPQDVINSQFAETFDILVAIFWTRVGAATPRSISGSIEEVSIAIQRIRKNPNSAKLLVYFKSANPPLDSIDPTQFAQLIQFKESLGSEGVLYKTFPDVDALRGYLGPNLTHAAKELLDHSIDLPSAISTTPQKESVADEIIDDDDDNGLLDYEDIHASKTAVATELVDGMAAALQTLTASMHRRTSEINNLQQNQPVDRGELRRLLLRSASDMDEASTKISEILSKLEVANREAFAALSRAVPLMSTSTESAKAARIKLAEKLDDLGATFKVSILSNAKFRSTILQFPRMIAEHNRAKKRMTKVLAQAESHFGSVVALTADIAMALRNM